MQIGATYISQFGNEPPGAFLQPAALGAGRDVSLARSVAVSSQRRVQLSHENTAGASIRSSASTPAIRTAAVITPRCIATASRSSCRTPASRRSSRKRPATSIRSIRARAPNRTSPRRAAFTNRDLPGGLLTTPRIDADMTIEYSPPTKSLAQIGLRLASAKPVQPDSTTCRSSTAATAFRSPPD